MKAAIFDFDGTITNKDTFIEFGRFAVGTSRFICAVMLSAPYLAAWKCGLISSSRAKQHLFSRLFRGMEQKRFADLGRSFAYNINKILRPEVIQFLHKHLDNGVDCYIISASIEEWIAPWAKANGFKDVAATRVEIDEHGRLTGRFLGKNCLGKEKVCRLEALLPDYQSYETWAYSDSKSDMPLLNIVNHGMLL